MTMATLDEESAEECMYALPRGGKPIKGPSIRFAEILKQSFGNCRAGARVVDVDRVEMFVEAEGVFHDLETNASTTARVRRRISDKNGRIFKDDMIIVTGNAACSIAMRNAILAGVPKPLWRKAYDSVQATITGDITTLSENREKALKALAAFGVKPEQIFASLGREGLEDINVEDIATLRGMYSALKNGEATVEEMFFGTVKTASAHEKIADPLSDEPSAAQQPTSNVQSKSADEGNGEPETALPGEIIDNTNSGDESPAPSSDNAGTSPVNEAGADDVPASDAPASTDPERDILIRFAAEMLPMAATAPTEAWKEVEKGWSEGEMKTLSDASKAKAKSISQSIRAIANNQTSLESAAEFHAEGLGCKASDLGGVDG
ncbi:hypothetical protein [Agrobacterium sp. SUL3]|uniref:hypothetical protein n=1 Tax=Agrobacterium sp. SUL3 TaxID=1701910 RepID=UPI0012E26B41|nr:hypothetical protein [Agrobacterium sp. SUL3]